MERSLTQVTMVKTRGLTPRQQRFVDEYLLDLNATQAAVRAGYSEKTASWIGPQLLGKLHVAEAVETRKKMRETRTHITADAVLQLLWDTATVDVNELVELRREQCGDCWRDELAPADPTDPDPDCLRCRGEGICRPFFKDTRSLSPAARALYAGVKETKNGLEILMSSRDKARELLGRHLGLFVDKLEHSGPGGGPIPHIGVTVQLTAPELRAAVLSALEKV